MLPVDHTRDQLRTALRDAMRARDRDAVAALRGDDATADAMQARADTVARFLPTTDGA